MEDYSGSEDSLETESGVPEQLVPEFIWDQEPATGLHPEDEDTASTDLEERNETSPLLQHQEVDYKLMLIATTKVHDSTSSNVSLNSVQPGNWLDTTLNTLQLPLRMFSNLRSKGGASIPRQCQKCQSCRVRRCGDCRYCFQPALKGPCLRKPACLQWRGVELRNWNDQHEKLLEKYPLNKVHKAIMPSPKAINTTMQQCRQLENSFVQEPQGQLDQSKTNKTIESVNDNRNITNNSLKEKTTTEDDMDYVQRFINTKIKMNESKTTQMYHILDEIQTNNQTFLAEQFFDEDALTTIRLESNNCRELHESTAIPKLLELEKQLLALESNCNTMKESYDNQKKLDANQTGAFRVILGLDPNTTQQSVHRSDSEASSIRYQQLSQAHNRTVTENQTLQLNLANTTKALERSDKKKC